MLDIAWVDTIDICHMKCTTCLRGARAMENTSQHMTVELFSRIAPRLRQDGYPRVGFYNWTEPFLNKRIHEFVAIAKANGLGTSISSTLSLPRVRQLEDTLVAGLDQLIVTTSGADQATYEINHKGGNLTQVFENLARVSEIIRRRRLNTSVYLRFLRFDYNSHQLAEMRFYARCLGFNFDEVAAYGDPKADVYQGVGRGNFAELVREGAEAPGPSPEESGKVCGLMFDQTVIDCQGDVYLCCSVPTYSPMRIGHYLDMTADEILAKKFVHPFCRTCTMPRRDPAPDHVAWLQQVQGLIAQARAEQPVPERLRAVA